MLKRMLAVLLVLSAVCGISLAEEDAVTSATLAVDRLPAMDITESNILVVFFSPGDTVRAAAYAVAGTLSAELFEIEPVEPYTEDDLNYFNSKARSMMEMADKNARPEIVSLPENLDRYDTVLLGYPIWGGQAPRIISTFLESVDLSGKTVIPFCTSNSSGIGSSAKNLHSLAGDSVVWTDGVRIPKGSTEEEIRALAETLIPEE